MKSTGKPVQIVKIGTGLSPHSAKTQPMLSKPNEATVWQISFAKP
jgi:hypothetical protein